MRSLPPSKPPTGPAPPRRSVCARDDVVAIVSQTNLERENRPCHSTVGCKTSDPPSHRPGPTPAPATRLPRAATHRPNLEVLEDRSRPASARAVSYPVGANPQAVVAGGLQQRQPCSTSRSRNYRRQHGQRAAGQRRRHVPAGPELRHRRRPASRSRSATSTATATSTSRPPTPADVSVLLGNGDGTFGSAEQHRRRFGHPHVRGRGRLQRRRQARPRA